MKKKDQHTRKINNYSQQCRKGRFPPTNARMLCVTMLHRSLILQHEPRFRHGQTCDEETLVGKEMKKE